MTLRAQCASWWWNNVGNFFLATQFCVILKDTTHLGIAADHFNLMSTIYLIMATFRVIMGNVTKYKLPQTGSV